MTKSTLILNKLILESLKNNTLLSYYQICILQELASKKIPEKFSKKNWRFRARGNKLLFFTWLTNYSVCYKGGSPMKLNKTILKTLIERELNNILSEQMAGMGGGGSMIETSRTILRDALDVVKREDPDLGKKMEELINQLMEDGNI